MRLLVSFTGGSGHFLPLVPYARAALEHGNDVLVACQPAMLAAVRRAGFEAVDTGGRTLAAPDARRPLIAVDRVHEANVLRDVFAGSVAQERAELLLGCAGSWQPDVVLRDEVDFGAAVVAERLGIPHVAVVVLAAGGLLRPELVAASLDRLRARHGLPADPDTTMLHRHLTLVPAPPSYRTPDDPLPGTARHVRPAVLDQPGPVPPIERADRPTVYVTLGTVFHQESGDLFPRILDGLRPMDVDVVVTVGQEVDPAELGEQPSNVRVERFVPQQDLLPLCSAVVSHAGSGSVLGALAFGVPLVLLPMGADQPQNADRCAELGVARVLDPLTVTAGGIRAAVTEVLTDPGYARRVTALAAEIRDLPGAPEALGWIEQLVR